MNRKAPIFKNFFLKQSRRDNTHEVQLTPHKAKPQCGAYPPNP